jgi:hypothetical protein
MSKNSVRTLIKNTLLIKNANHHLSLLEVVIYLLMEGLASMFDGCWLIRVVDTEGWGVCKKFRNIARITKIWHGDTKWAHAVGKIAPID